MKNVLIITYYFAPAPLAYSQRMVKLCKYLSLETNWHPHVICGELPWDLLPGRDDVLLNEVPNDVKITRVYNFISSNLAYKLRKWNIYLPVGIFRKFYYRFEQISDWISLVSGTEIE
jgi:hypothetical protein